MIIREKVYINRVEFIRAVSDNNKWLELNGQRSNEFLYKPSEKPDIIETNEIIVEEESEV